MQLYLKSDMKENNGKKLNYCCSTVCKNYWTGNYLEYLDWS